MASTTSRIDAPPAPPADRPAPHRGGGGPSLRGPEPDEAWRVERVIPAEAAPEKARLGPGEHLLVEPDPGGRGTLIKGMVLAVCVIAAVLGGMAVLSHGNGPTSTQSASVPTH
jgi:hypothetical protein